MSYKIKKNKSKCSYPAREQTLRNFRCAVKKLRIDPNVENIIAIRCSKNPDSVK
jgi:hypothetical protein